MKKNVVMILLPKREKEDYYKVKFVDLMKLIMNKYKNSIKFEQKGETMKLIIKNNFETPEKLLEFLNSFSREVSVLFRNEKSKSV